MANNTYRVLVTPGQDAKALAEDYRYMGWHAKVEENILVITWGKRREPKKVEDDDKEKTARRRTKDENRLRGKHF